MRPTGVAGKLSLSMISHIRRGAPSPQGELSYCRPRMSLFSALIHWALPAGVACLALLGVIRTCRRFRNPPRGAATDWPLAILWLYWAMVAAAFVVTGI